ncbi:MAG: RibD family protein [Hyphomonadaceae bacterium]|nr:RibD family protein [Hyphomonadaceae bacterium]
MKRPQVTLKLATSLDGRIATGAGESRWITGEAARAEVQKLRAAHDAVMIGAGTARADDPSLLARTEPLPERQPKRVVLSKNFDVPTGGRLFDNLEESSLIILGAGPGAASARAAKAGAQIGHIINEGPVDVSLAFHSLLTEWQVQSVLCEGGGQLAASLIVADVVDRLEWFRAPMVLGDGGRPAVAALALSSLAAAPRFRRVALRELGPDIWESYERVS